MALLTENLALKGVIVRSVNLEAPTKIDITTFGDTEPKYINGLPGRINLDISCTAEGYQHLVAALTGQIAEEVPIPDRPLVGPTERPVKL